MNVKVNVFFKYFGEGIRACILSLGVKLSKIDESRIVDKLRRDLKRKFPGLIRDSYNYDEMADALSSLAQDNDDEVRSYLSLALDSLAEIYSINKPGRAILTKSYYTVTSIDRDFNSVLKKLIESSRTLKDFIKAIHKVAFDIDFEESKIFSRYLGHLRDLSDLVN